MRSIELSALWFTGPRTEMPGQVARTDCFTSPAMTCLLHPIPFPSSLFKTRTAMCHLCDIRKSTTPAQRSRRGFLQLASGVAAGLAFAPRAFAKDTKPPPKPQNAISPDEALERL